MPEGNLKEFTKFLDSIKAISHDEFESVLHYFPKKFQKEQTKGQFFMMQCTAEEIRENDFVEFITDRIIQYVLKRKEYLLEGLSPEDRAAKMRPLLLKAKRKFMTKNKKTGEGGELILFLILESNGIIQLLNKMNLKTNQEMPIHGLDAIHIQVDNDIIFHYGESKMYADFNEAVKKALNDIKKFGGEKEKLELDLVSSYIDDSKFDSFTNEIVDLISPYSKSKNKENVRKTNSIFIGHDWKGFKLPYSNGEIKLADFLKTNYQKLHEQLFPKVTSLVSSEIGDNTKTFNFYIMPFRDVGEFRNKFREELKK